ncbi:hypothetical protein ACWEK5_32645 [Rhodococcus koreensis]
MFVISVVSVAVPLVPSRRGVAGGVPVTPVVFDDIVVPHRRRDWWT